MAVIPSKSAIREQELLDQVAFLMEKLDKDFHGIYSDLR
jgi:hypothetical protein